MEKKQNSKIFWIIIAIIAAIILSISIFDMTGPTEVNYSSFKNLLIACDNNDVATQQTVLKDEFGIDGTDIVIDKVEFDDYAVNFTVKFKYTIAQTDGVKEFVCYYSRGSASVEDLETLLSGAKIDYTYTNPNETSILSYIFPIIMVGISLVFIIMLFRSSGGGAKGAMSFGKTTAKMHTNVKTRFSDVAGAEEEKEELKEIVDFLKAPKKYSELGARIPKGVLLVGPPGTGKTLFARAVAGEAGVPFFTISGSDFVEMFVGVGASRVRDLFEVAKKNMPCIVFIDEIDAVGRQRGTGLGGGNDEKEQTLNQLLVEMDGFAGNSGIIIMAATNRADILDPALLRPGRFDRQIYVHIPDVKGREAILKVHARNKPLAKDVNLKIVARMTSGFSGADLENLLNEAAILAARDNRSHITNKDLYEGVNKVLIGPQKKSRLITETDKRITAYHEAGHAILAKLLPHCDPVHEVSIIPRGQAAGYTMTRPDTDDSHVTKNKMLDDIVMTLGGRVAEELIIKDISAGASGDIQMITKRARAMVTEWGMSDKVGPISYGSDREVFIGRDMASHVTYSEKTAALIDEEVTRIIDEALTKARKLLTENKHLLDNMARLLIEKETIYAEEVNLLMEGKSCDEIIEFMDKHEKELSEKPFERNLSTAPTLDDEKVVEQVEEKVPESDDKIAQTAQNNTERYDETAPSDTLVDNNSSEPSTESTTDSTEEK